MGELVAQAPGGGPQLPFLALWVGGLLLIMYVLYIRPQRKQKQAHDQLLAGLKRGDRVLTAGGMYGTVLGVKDDTVVLRIGDEAKAEFRRSAVVEIVEKDKAGD